VRLASLVLVLLFATVASAQVYIERAVPAESSRQIADSPATFFGPFRINGEKPRGFEGFDFFILGYKEDAKAEKDDRSALVPDANGIVPVRGELVTTRGTPLTFASVKLTETGPITVYYVGPSISRVERAKKITLTFSTNEVKGVRYEFNGEYLDTPEEESEGFTDLRGIFKKFKYGKLVAEAKTAFKRLPYDALTEKEP
jgi:hypothetical protein